MNKQQFSIVWVYCYCLYSFVWGQAAPAITVGSTIVDSNNDGISEMPHVNYTVECRKDNYYSDLLASKPRVADWDKEDLTELLTTTHKNAVPSGKAVYEALIELDKGLAINTVHLVYRDKAMPANPYGDVETWTFEHLWPPERGANGVVSRTDLFNLRPEQTRITFMRQQLFYGECGTVEYADVCNTPATTATADDTATDGKVWLPPSNVRGDIARALMYMDLRYSSDNDINLSLVDCGPFGVVNAQQQDGQAPDKLYKMGYLSQLLKWHEEDPVNDRERIRNTNVCANYQGNRNPLVDYPELVTQLFGFPNTLAKGKNTYEACLDIPTPSPTAIPNACNIINEGDIVFYVVEADNPDGVGFLALRNIPGGLELYMTDNAWTGYNFLATEGVLRMVVPEEGMKAGQYFGFGPTYGTNKNYTWVPEEGLFDIGVTGDTVILYCKNSDDSPRPIIAFSNNINNGPDNDKSLPSGWLPTGLHPDEYGTQYSALPETLKEKSLAFEHFDNWYYDGEVQEAKREELEAAMLDEANWRGSDVTNEGRGASGATRKGAAVNGGMVGMLLSLSLSSSSLFMVLLLSAWF